VSGGTPVGSGGSPVRTRWLLALLSLVALCRCGGHTDADIAELSEVLSGAAQRSEQGTAWGPAATGARFRAGDGVRTSSDGGARLRFLAGGGLRMGPSTTVQFGAGALAVEGELEAEGDDALIDLEVGRAHIAAGSRVRIGRRGREVHFDVLFGSAVVTRDERRVEVAAGQAVDLELDSGKIERVPGEAAPDRVNSTPPAPDSPPAGQSPAPAPDQPAADGALVGDVQGQPARIRPAGGEWAALPVGRHSLPAGAEIAVARGGSVAIARDDERAVVRGPAELVVAPSGPGGVLLEARRGRAEVRALAADVTVRVPGGRIVARRDSGSGPGPATGSGADLGVERGETRVVATAGIVDVVGDQGGKERLVRGQASVVEGGGSLRVEGRPPSRADFTIAAGLTATIHDAAPPTDVRIRFADLCPEAGVVEMAQGESFRAARVRVDGRGAGIVRLARGRHRYRVRCFEGSALADVVVATGRLEVTRDSGTRPLARQAPHNTVDADGRRYTVLYQNRLPAITFRWPSAPEADRYRLHIAPRRGRPIEVTTSSPSHATKPGELAEGQYRYWFAAGGRESTQSTLTIDFDNAARSGYLQAPRPDAEWNDSATVVSGAAIEGWRVAVGGAALPLDRQHRFTAPITRAADENGIAVEFSHPEHGVHLYVRRSRR
jgi:hypothetical protein